MNENEYIEIPVDIHEPCEEEIKEYAKWLGADLSTDQDLFYICREALIAPLPEGWKLYQKKDESGDPFYFNTITGQSSWDHPLESYYKDLFQKEKQKKSLKFSLINQIKGKKSTYKKYIVDPNNYRNIRQINKGGFGSVYEVQNNKTGEKFAAKIIKFDIKDFNFRQSINREILIMIQCQHPTIIKLHGYSYKDIFGDKNITIFMDLAQNGSLSDLLQNTKKGTAPHAYDNTIRQMILVGIAGGMMHLHNHHVIHCDLKPGNVLLDSDFHPHLTDFGLSRIFNYHQNMKFSKNFGTYAYMAPELLTNNEHNEKIDVYSFGILMFEVITDSELFPLFEKKKITEQELIEKVVNENYRPQFEVPVKKSLKKLIERCWSKDPQNRPSFEEIFNKLAFNIDDVIYDIFEEQEIIKSDNDDDDDDDDDELKYYLDDVDIEEVILYADTIQKVGNSDEYDQILKKLEIQENSISPLKRDNYEMRKQFNEIVRNKIDPLVNASNEIKRENERIKRENQVIKRENEEMKYSIARIKSENISLKREIQVMKNQIKNIVQKETTTPIQKQKNNIECDDLEDEGNYNLPNSVIIHINNSIDNILIDASQPQPQLYLEI